ncbi:MAG: DUF503 domain-containing protein [Armatimonadota bacterium]|nr:DUF503 domain-containing protein [Armatimonadota bacterium]MDR7438414.1 DUF503 domain-containing protein [Armatimonadota bacterium]MDR7562213.1 DUF503 domain-containing protein [Armatimonadota bacterium]MDR7567193.1 DUF503 domain-containing protein [Armatimonadota bacterium]MDR7601258.1 DUF503 domain-containing protein [Armatimonadota bacterium]
MVVGTLRVALSLPGPRNLKDKRRIVHSLLQRLHNEFAVAAAEVDDQDLWGRATLGIAVVSNNGQHADQVLAQVLRYIERQPEAVIVDYDVEIR